MKVFIEVISENEQNDFVAAFQENSLFIETVTELLDFITNEKTVKCYLDADFAENLNNESSTLLGTFVQSPRFEPVKFEKKNGVNYFIWQPYDCQEIKENLSFCKIADYQLDYHSKCILVSLNDHNFLQPHIVIRQIMPFETNFTTILRCNNVNDFKNWLAQKRIFNQEYKKHGVNGDNNQSGESKLYCSYDEAQALLDGALGDENTEHLFNYDAKYKRFIKFKHENRGFWYHGYHVESEDEKLQIFDCINNTTANKLRQLQKDRNKR